MNRSYVSPALQCRIAEFLDSPSVRRAAKDALLDGLSRDCVDSANDAHDVAEILAAVSRDVLAGTLAEMAAERAADRAEMAAEAEADQARLRVAR